MENTYQEWLAHFDGEIFEPEELEATENFTDTLCVCGHARVSHDIEPPYACDICDCTGFTYRQAPRSTGGAGYTRAEVAGVAQERTVSPPPTVEDAA